VTPQEADAIIERAFPMSYEYGREPWRSKTPKQMDARELQEALSEALASETSNKRWYESDEPMDYEDRADA
jgi:hypothetical protein